MKGDLLPDDDHVVRYVRPGLIDGKQVDGGAFVRKEEETALSINWLDYFQNQTKENKLQAVRGLFRLDVRRNGRFAELNVGQTRKHVTSEIKTLKFVEDPLTVDLENNYDADPSHALIEGLPDPNNTPEFAEMIGDMIQERVIALHLAIEN